jgi:hypothetical protein
MACYGDCFPWIIKKELLPDESETILPSENII